MTFRNVQRNVICYIRVAHYANIIFHRGQKDLTLITTCSFATRREAGQTLNVIECIACYRRGKWEISYPRTMAAYFLSAKSIIAKGGSVISPQRVYYFFSDNDKGSHILSVMVINGAQWTGLTSCLKVRPEIAVLPLPMRRLKPQADFCKTVKQSSIIMHWYLRNRTTKESNLSSFDKIEVV